MKKIISSLFAAALIIALPIKVFAKDDTPQKKIAITFDDGPSKYTEEILDYIEENGGAVTFMVLGENAENFTDTVRRASSLGCEIGCHGWSHKDMRKLSDRETARECERCASLIESVCSKRPTVFRAPYGEFTDSAKKAGMHCIKWSVDTLDWKTRKTEAVVNAILNNAKDGDIILLHDIFKTSADGFIIAAKELSKRGFELVTVSELLGLSKKAPDGTVYYKRQQKGIASAMPYINESTSGKCYERKQK